MLIYLDESGDLERVMRDVMLPSELMADIRFPSVIIVTGEWAQVKCATLSCGIERGWHCFIIIFLRLAGFFQQFLKYVCPAFSAPGFRSGVPRRGDKRQRSEIRDQKSEVRDRKTEGRERACRIS